MKRIDLTGKRYGKLVVLGVDNSKQGQKIFWQCQCDCGNLCSKTKDSLERGVKNNPNTFGCSIQCTKSIPLGTVFSKLTVVKMISTQGSETRYECQCDCGNKTIVLGQNLKTGNTKSCGCWQSERMSIIGKEYSQPHDISGQVFGLLTAIKPTEDRVNRSIIWECRCQCGNLHYASINNLLNGDVTRCSSCYVISKGEEKIRKILEENNISFEMQKTFSSCRFIDTNMLARFDFYIDNKYIIEFDGEQHFHQGGWNDNKNFEKVQQHDEYKNQWCKNNNIPLIRIPYWKKDDIVLEDLLLSSSKYII